MSLFGYNTCPLILQCKETIVSHSKHYVESTTEARQEMILVVEFKGRRVF